MKTGVLLINLGTPDSSSNRDVRKYLREFLNDPRVIDSSPLSRFLLVNLIIAPFRAPKSAKLYEKIWTGRGSPLLFHGQDVKEKLQQALGENYIVEFGMRYQNPSVSLALQRLQKKNVQKLVIIPLYPQYASSSTGSTLAQVNKIISKWEVIPDMQLISQFYDHPGFTNTIAKIAQQYDVSAYDHVLFSFHGLPERQIKKADNSNTCLIKENCCKQINQHNHHCYRATCYATAVNIAEKLSIPENKYSVSFQSRLGKTPWIKPYSDEVIIKKAKEGIKKLLVFSPAFVADCLETLYEIGTEYNHLFQQHGGEKVQLVESLNSDSLWIETLKSMVISAC